MRLSYASGMEKLRDIQPDPDKYTPACTEVAVLPSARANGRKATQESLPRISPYSRMLTPDGRPGNGDFIAYLFKVSGVHTCGSPSSGRLMYLSVTVGFDPQVTQPHTQVFEEMVSV
jgi:hypothetical protein